MTRYDKYGPLDEAPKPLGDRGWVGVMMRQDPGQLPPGYAAAAVNMRFRSGVAESRKGFAVLPWINKIVDGETQPWGDVHGTGVFSDPFTHQDYIVIAADGAAYYTQANNIPQSLGLPTGETLAGSVTFTQAFDVLVMHRGAESVTLEMPRISTGFQLVDQSPDGNGTYPIPNATHSLFLQNRLFVPKADDVVAVSDNGDYTRYLPVQQEFRVNQGSADSLVGLNKFNETTIIAFKGRSVYAISNVYGDLSDARQDELTNQFGLVARKSVAQVGRDLWFLSGLGVMSITQTEQNKLQGVVLPVSDPIHPLIERINWRFAGGACAAVWDSKYYLAVPLDDAEVFGPELTGGGAIYDSANAALITNLVAGATYRWVKGVEQTVGSYQLANGSEQLDSTADFVAQGTSVTLYGTGTITASLRRVYKGVNNAVLVYDFLNQAWAGHDEAEGIAFRDFHLLPYQGELRLFAVTQDGYLLLYEEDFEDALPVPYADVTVIPDLLATTGTGLLQVNGGTSIDAHSTDSVNTGNSLGTNGGYATMVQNLWMDGSGSDNGGYNPGANSPWSAPDTNPVKLSNGVRFYATNGVMPDITVEPEVFVVSPVAHQGVRAQLVTRGYASDVAALGDFRFFVADLQTWAPSFTVTVSTPGVEETTDIVTDETKDRAAYYEPANAAAFEQDNDNGDFLTPYREDYSVVLADPNELGAAPVDFAVHTVTAGVPLGLHQEHRLTERVTLAGRYAQATITNTAGRIRVMGVALEMDEEQITAGERA